jgi:uncharacterized RDD family membrane protein YckC
VYAGFWLRFAARLIDGAIFFVGLLSLTVFASLFIGHHDQRTALVNIYGLVLWWLYFALMESSPYQGTLGKLAVGLKVTDQHGAPISFARATGRHFAKILSAMILMLGYIMAGFTEKKQALHDMLADCLVLRR